MSKVRCPECFRVAKAIYYRLGGDRPVVRSGAWSGRRVREPLPRGWRRIPWAVYCHRDGVVRVTDQASIREEDPRVVEARRRAAAPQLAALVSRIRRR